MAILRIIFLGTSAAIPTKNRNLSSTAVVRDNELLLFDTGEGVQRAIAEAKLGLNRKTKIFITHMHGDHIVGLLGILQSMSMAMRDKPLDIYGPKEVYGFVRESIRYLRFGVTYPLNIHEVHKSVVVDEKEYRVLATKGNHSTTNFAYVIEEKKRAGVFHPKRAIRLGVPKGELWSILQRGKSVRVGRKIIKADAILGKSRPGRRIGISGDTRPDQKLIKFFSSCDVLIFDSTYGEQHKDLALERLHSTSREAAIVCKRSKSRLLILTHFSSRYSNVIQLEKEAKRIHRNTIAANDMMMISVPYPDEGKVEFDSIRVEQSS